MKIRMIRLSVLLICSAQSTFPQKELRPLPVQVALQAKSFASHSPIDLSPDGLWVAYTVRNPSRVNAPKEYSELWFTPTGVPTLSRMDGCDVWIAETKSGRSINLTEGKGSSWNPVWSPDGNYLAFYSDRGGFAGLWVWDKPTRNLRQVSTAIVRTFNGFETVGWTPDSKRVLTKVLPENMTIKQANDLFITPLESRKDLPKEEGSSVVVYSSSGSSGEKTQIPASHSDLIVRGRTGLYLSDVALIDVISGEVKRLARAVKAVECRVSPEGNNIACTIAKGARVNTQQFLFDLMVVSLTTLRAHVVAENVAQPFALLNWSPDGKSLGYVTTGASTYGGTNSKGDYYIVPIEGAKPRNLTAGSNVDFSAFTATPLWDAKGESIYALGAGTVWKISLKVGTVSELAKIPNRQILDIITPSKSSRFWSPDDQSLYVITRDDMKKQQGIFKVDLMTGESTKLLEENREYVKSTAFSMDVTADATKIVYITEDSQNGKDIWTADVDFRNPKRVTTINPEIDRYLMGNTQLVEWRSSDGEQLHGSLLLPADYERGKKYPMIVLLYAGDYLSNGLNHFGGSFSGEEIWNMQLLATRGYAVLFPDVPMRHGSRMEDVAKAVMTGVDKVVEMGIADNDRVGVMGHSYGGYSALSLIVQTTRFKAAVSSGGIANLLSHYTQMSDGTSIAIGWAEKGQGGMGGTPWEFREKYIENSPFFYLDRVQTPLLILHGEEDGAYRADEVFVSLRRLGKEVVYAKYKGESHNLKGYANQIDFSNRMISWFDKWLKPASTKQNALD